MITCVWTVTVVTFIRASINSVDCASQNGISRGIGVRDGSHWQYIMAWYLCCFRLKTAHCTALHVLFKVFTKGYIVWHVPVLRGYWSVTPSVLRLLSRSFKNGRVKVKGCAQFSVHIKIHRRSVDRPVSNSLRWHTMGFKLAKVHPAIGEFFSDSSIINLLTGFITLTQSTLTWREEVSAKLTWRACCEQLY